MTQLADQYPGSAAFGSDYFTRAAQREIEVDGERRLERVIVTDVNVDFEGDVCVSETTVRYWAHMLGMYDAGAVDEVIAENARIKSERDNLSQTLASAYRALEEARADAGAIPTIFVANDGTEHASKAACDERNAELVVGIAPSQLEPIKEPQE